MTGKFNRNIDKSEELLYTISEIAEILKVNKNFVYTLINDGHLHKISIPKSKVLGAAYHGRGLEGLLKRYFG